MFFKTYIFIAFTLSFVKEVSLLKNIAELEGRAYGYMSDCPGSTKKAIITKASLKELTFSVRGVDIFLRKYDYYQMAKLVKDPDLDFNKTTVIYVAGFLENPYFPVPLTVASKYKRLGYNVLLLDTVFFTAMEYPRAARLSRAVGKHAAEMLAEVANYGLDPNKIQLIGLSLGSHVAGFMGRHFRALTGKSLSRITALDPAGPCFRYLDSNDRLDKSDADFVDVILTNIDGYGMARPIGHANFYVNGGELQPGSLFWTYTSVFQSHLRAFTLWNIMLDNQLSFIAIKCDSVQEARDRNCFERTPQETNIMGLRTNKSNQGIFYLATSENHPYYLGKKGTKRENDFFFTYPKLLNKDEILTV